MRRWGLDGEEGGRAAGGDGNVGDMYDLSDVTRFLNDSFLDMSLL